MIENLHIERNINVREVSELEIWWGCLNDVNPLKKILINLTISTSRSNRLTRNPQSFDYLHGMKFNYQYTYVISSNIILKLDIGNNCYTWRLSLSFEYLN